jgi:hypothetical protein
MSELTDNFVAWATDPRRTSDELFTVEVLLEKLRISPKWPFRDRRQDFDEQWETTNTRRLNPAHRPSLPLDELQLLQQSAEIVTAFGHSGMSDRSIRDLTALSYFPGLEDINLTNTNVSDLSPLRPLKRLKHFTLMQAGRFVEVHPLDLGQLGEMPVMETAFLSFGHSWPGLRAMATWPLLRELRFHGSILAFAEIDELPALEFLLINGSADDNTQLRDLKKFPTMPKLKRLTLYSTASLEGIERYPTLLNLEIGGHFQSLSPLRNVPNATAVVLTAEQFQDLSPLLRMPKLREVMFHRERPLDLAPLSEAPHLRRVEYERCAFIRTELTALNAALIPEETDFLAEEPRPLQPTKFWLVPKDNEAAKKFVIDRTTELAEMRTKSYDGDVALTTAETRSALYVMQARLDAMLGRGWGLTSSWGKGRMYLNFKRYKDTTRIREIIQLVREFSAAQSLPWLFEIMVEPHGDMTYELKQLKELEKKEKEPEGHWLAPVLDAAAAARENEELAERYHTYYQMLERQHIYQLQQQYGGERDPTFPQPPRPPTSKPPSPRAIEEADDEDEEEDQLPDQSLSSNQDQDDDDSGGVAVAPPPPAPQGTPDLSDHLCYAIEVFEDAIFVNEGWADRARYGLGEAPVEWKPADG